MWRQQIIGLRCGTESEEDREGINKIISKTEDKEEKRDREGMGIRMEMEEIGIEIKDRGITGKEEIIIIINNKTEMETEAKETGKGVTELKKSLTKRNERKMKIESTRRQEKHSAKNVEKTNLAENKGMSGTNLGKGCQQKRLTE